MPTLLLVLALLVAGCGGSDSTETEQAASTEADSPAVVVPTTGETAETVAPIPESEPPTESSASPTEAPPVDGPEAPNFEMSLADGTAFSLTDEQKPVYLVFWAEW